VHRVADRLRELGTDRELLLTRGRLGCGQLAARRGLPVGVRGPPTATGPRWVGLLVAFGLANVLAAIPITPGGLGVVEAVLTSTLVGFGTPSAVAILGGGDLPAAELLVAHPARRAGLRLAEGRSGRPG